MKAIIANLARTDDSSFIQDVPIAKACLRKLKDNHRFNYCLEIGIKTIDLTQNLNPRSHLVDKIDARQLEYDIEARASQVLHQDKTMLLENLQKLKLELSERKTESKEIL